MIIHGSNFRHKRLRETTVKTAIITDYCRLAFDGNVEQLGATGVAPDSGRSLFDNSDTETRRADFAPDTA